MARLVEEKIINEDETTVTIRFTRRSGSYLDRTVNKIAGKTNEDLLRAWHRRMTLEVLQNRISPNKWTAA